MRELNLSSGTANRIMKALMANSLVMRNPETDCYYLGRGAVLLGQAAQRSFGIDKMMPLLEQLNELTQESVNLSIRDGADSVVMLRVQSTLPLRFEQRTGARFPLYTTASGKVILAFSAGTDAYISGLPHRLHRVTPHTLGTRDDVQRAIEETWARGYSVDEQENVEGVRCVGAPVLDGEGRAQAAIVIQVPTVRMAPPRMRELAQQAVRTANEAAQFLPVNRPLSG
jgi:IclR family acetate operon transcriptional repressor